MNPTRLVITNQIFFINPKYDSIYEKEYDNYGADKCIGPTK